MIAEALIYLHEISASINRLWSDPDGLAATLRLIVDSAAAILPGATVDIYAYDTDQRVFTALAGSPAESTAEPDPLALHAVSEMCAVFADGASIRGCFPLLAGKDVVGVLCARRAGDLSFTEPERLLLDTLANQATQAITHSSRLSNVRRDLARKEDELHRLRRAGLLISSRTQLEETLVAILQMALEVTGANYGIFRLVDKESENLIMRAIAGERLGQPAIEALPLNTTSITGLVAKTRQPVCIRDVRADPWSHIYYPLDYSLEMRSELAVPLVGASGRLEGVLNLESPVVGAFSEDDSHLLQALATQAVIAIQEVRLLDALQDMAERLLAQPLPQALDHLVELACDLLNTAASAVWTLQDDHLALAAASAGHERGQNLPLHDSLTGQAIVSRELVISEDVRNDPRFAWPELARQAGLEACHGRPPLSQRRPGGGRFERL